MGKVLSSFNHGYAGAIARSLDDVVITMANKGGKALAFGVPVALSTKRDGIIPFDGSKHTAADFVGVTVRNPSKTPDAYGADTATYAVNDLVDVLVRGHIVVAMDDDTTPKVGDAVAIDKSSGIFAVGTGDSVISLTNAHVTATMDNDGMVEIVLNTRNIV